MLDTDNSGHITLEELKTSMQSCGYFDGLKNRCFNVSSKYSKMITIRLFLRQLLRTCIDGSSAFQLL
jgi:Ca2+-binding EF-hand superfamily protein